MSDLVSFWVPGKPAPKGSHRAFVHRGRAIVTDDTPATKQWERAVMIAARYAMRGATMFAAGVPVSVSVTFAVKRPRSHYGTGKNASALKQDAPLFPVGRIGDVDKLLRSALDGLTGEVFADDCQVVAVEGRKIYAPAGQPIGAEVRVRAVMAGEMAIVESGYLDQVWLEQPRLRPTPELSQTEMDLGN